MSRFSIQLLHDDAFVNVMPSIAHRESSYGTDLADAFGVYCRFIP